MCYRRIFKVKDKTRFEPWYEVHTPTRSLAAITPKITRSVIKKLAVNDACIYFIASHTKNVLIVDRNVSRGLLFKKYFN